MAKDSKRERDRLVKQLTDAARCTIVVSDRKQVEFQAAAGRMVKELRRASDKDLAGLVKSAESLTKKAPTHFKHFFS